MYYISMTKGNSILLDSQLAAGKCYQKSLNFTIKQNYDKMSPLGENVTRIYYHRQTLRLDLVRFVCYQPVFLFG